MAGLRERFPPRRIARLIGWNLLILFVLLALAAGGAEAFLRLTVPFRENVLPVHLEPGVGVIRPPHAEVRHTNGLDFWQVSRANSLGFLDREPPDPARAAASCHVTLIGDSFVEAMQVPIADKAQVRLEELAAREAPELDVTTSAFGYSNTGQINQLAFYDRYARRLSPDVVALVMAGNDFRNNSPALQSWSSGNHPDYPPHLSARRGVNGEMEFVPPAAGLDELRAMRYPRIPQSSGRSVEGWLRERSYLADRLWGIVRRDGALRLGGGTPFRISPEQRLAWAVLISQHPRHESFARGWHPAGIRDELFLAEAPPPVYREALDMTRFALEQFRERTERDGAALVILAMHQFRGPGDPWFDLLHSIASNTGEGVPIINQYEHITARGDDVSDARWARDYHWNATGHRWAAEAIWEWLKANPEVCD